MRWRNPQYLIKVINQNTYEPTWLLPAKRESEMRTPGQRRLGRARDNGLVNANIKGSKITKVHERVPTALNKKTRIRGSAGRAQRDRAGFALPSPLCAGNPLLYTCAKMASAHYACLPKAVDDRRHIQHRPGTALARGIDLMAVGSADSAAPIRAEIEGGGGVRSKNDEDEGTRGGESAGKDNGDATPQWRRRRRRYWRCQEAEENDGHFDVGRSLRMRAHEGTACAAQRNSALCPAHRDRLNREHTRIRKADTFDANPTHGIECVCFDGIDLAAVIRRNLCRLLPVRGWFGLAVWVRGSPHTNLQAHFIRVARIQAQTDVRVDNLFDEVTVSLARASCGVSHKKRTKNKNVKCEETEGEKKINKERPKERKNAQAEEISRVTRYQESVNASAWPQHAGGVLRPVVSTTSVACPSPERPGKKKE
ncbi:hypothetical protein C8F04DRAFT_1234998 [Mycena alexandri]|uniref:Uncharacterized protein n=1 Tax=Mycena alexandri TaxID=1745969 RepID=A0AAD6STT9_9AGAR|nr:hypothetical protein C8F04DRAFT_1234998 [Mycena alexandri]